MIEWLKKLELGDTTLGCLGWVIWLIVFIIFSSIIPNEEDGHKSVGSAYVILLATVPVMYALYKLFDKIRRKP